MPPKKPKRVIIYTKRVNRETVIYSHIYVIINPILVFGCAPKMIFSPSGSFVASTDATSFYLFWAIIISAISHGSVIDIFYDVPKSCYLSLIHLNNTHLIYALAAVIYTDVFWHRRNRNRLDTQTTRIRVIPRASTLVCMPQVPEKITAHRCALHLSSDSTNFEFVFIKPFSLSLSFDTSPHVCQCTNTRSKIIQLAVNLFSLPSYFFISSRT